MSVTIVANEFSEETRAKLQEEVDKLANEYHYSNHAIMQQLAKRRLLAVSLNLVNGQAIMSCHSTFK